MIVQKRLDPSREDAVKLTRNEKMAMLLFAYAATILDDLQQDIGGRLGMIPDGKERLEKLSKDTDQLLHECRLTIPENQRKNLQNTIQDFEVRFVPKMTPSQTSVVMQKEEFRELVDIARTKCWECTEDDDTCAACQLYQVLTVVLPLEDYHNNFLCPYNLGEWVN